MRAPLAKPTKAVDRLYYLEPWPGPTSDTYRLSSQEWAMQTPEHSRLSESSLPSVADVGSGPIHVGSESAL